MRATTTTCCSFLFLGTLLAQGAAAQGDTVVLLSNFVTSPTSEIAGLPGFRYEAFELPCLSPDGEHWILNAESDNPSTGADTLVVVDGAAALVEGSTPSFLASGDFINRFDDRVSINDAGQYSVVIDSNAVSSEDDFVVRGDSSGTFTLIARQGSPINGLPGLINGSLSGAVITELGVVGCVNESVVGTSGGTADDDFLLLGSTILGQKGVTIPTGQLNGGMNPWQSFDFEAFWVSSNGMRYIAQGDLNTGETAMDDVVVVDGQVMIQEGFPIPGGPADVVDTSGIREVYMSHSGDWMAIGDFDITNQGWVVYNQEIVALMGQPIHVGTTETWTSIVFTAAACNGVGDYLVGGLTDGPDPISNRAVVLNNERVIVREGDPIDFDGNGLFDDDLFYDFLATNSFRLTDDLKAYFVATLRNSSSTNSVGEVFVMMDLSDDTVGDTYCVQTTPNTSGQLGALTAFGSDEVVDNDFTLEASNLPDGQFAYFIGSQTQGFVPNPSSSQGNLCVLGNIARFRAPGQFGAIAGGLFSRQLPLDSFPEPPSLMVQVMPGQTWSFQLWHRDFIVGSGPTSNFTAGLEVLFE